MYLIGALLWLWISILITRAVSRLLTQKSTRTWIRPLTALALLPFVFLAPLADEIVGKYQFDQLCEEAKEVTIHGTHPVGEELYTADGKWRRGETYDERNRLDDLYVSLIRYGEQSTYPEVISAAVPIWKFQIKVYDNTDGRLLAEWVKYGRSGGNLVGYFGESSHQCEPALLKNNGLKYLILPFVMESRK